LGLVRCSDITRLDRVGVPVFTAIRPSAAAGALDVHSGKSSIPLEAKVGALMEAIEHAWAEPQRARLPSYMLPAREVASRWGGSPELLLDFCPRLGVSIDPEEPLEVTDGVELTTGEVLPVPVELVVLPYTPGVGRRSIFGSTSNGLASGNSVTEAVVHGLLELIERDISSFLTLRDATALVEAVALPPICQQMSEAATRAGLELWIRAAPNDFGLPFFRAIVAEQQEMDPVLICAGHGCHWSHEVAVHRAITEALQSRLTFIHGGRDDLEERHGLFRNLGAGERRSYARSLLEKAKDASSIFPVGTHWTQPKPTSLTEAIATLIERVRTAGGARVVAVTLTPADHPLAVVRVVAQGLEHFSPNLPRAGRRAATWVKQHA
jgi:ribosomal protein S12 methylthiotransferase accessory factor